MTGAVEVVSVGDQAGIRTWLKLAKTFGLLKERTAARYAFAKEYSEAWTKRRAVG